jgi:hypothetical protein
VIEADWLGCTDPLPMLEFLRGRASDRKFRLFAVSQCRRLRAWFDTRVNAGDTPELAMLLDVGERTADGLAGQAELEEASRVADLVSAGGWSEFIGGAIGWADARDMGTFEHPEEWAVRSLATNCVPRWGYTGDQEWPDAADHAIAIMVRLACVKAEDTGLPIGPAERVARAELADWMREVFGNPFRPSPPSPAVLAWNDATVVRLAQAAYDERQMPEGVLDNGRLAVLADALEEAGCSDADILNHLRGPGPHGRGCWPVDLCLGKS